jgi:predicted peroxiredoxin
MPIYRRNHVTLFSRPCLAVVDGEVTHSSQNMSDSSSKTFDQGGKTMAKKFLINCQYGIDDLEKATVAMIVAGAASAMDGETAVFMTGDSVRLATAGGADGLQLEKYPAIGELVESFLENGGQLWVCPVCAGARDIGADDLIDGAEIAGAVRTIGFVNDGAQVLM